MLNKEQASAIADDLLLQERQRFDEERNAKARRAPWYLNVKELAGLKRWAMAEAVRAAKEAVSSRPLLAAPAFASFAVCAAAWYFVSSGTARPVSFIPFGVLAAVGALAARVRLVRAEVRRFVRERAGQDCHHGA